MDSNNRNGSNEVDYGKEVLYVFNAGEEGGMARTEETVERTTFWQFLPCFFASLTCIPFGLMLGWPCPTYPIILYENTEPGILISWDQSAMIAGFLMLGNTFGTPFSAGTWFSAKYGLLLGAFLMLIGWSLMWQASNIFWILGSRFIVGLGHTFCVGQLKIYISQLCNGDLQIIMIKKISLYAFFGVAVMVSFGSFLSFTTTAMISTIITAVIFMFLIFIPHGTKDISKTGPFQLPHLQRCNFLQSPFFEMFKDQKLRKNFAIFFILVLCQQYSGIAGTIIYAQITFEKFHCSNAKIFAIAYMVVYFLCNIVGVFVTSKYNKRQVLMLSSLGVSLVLIVEIMISHLNIDHVSWKYTSVAVIYLYVIIHTLGLGNIPFTLIPELFPTQYRLSIVHFFIMFHSILALTITKIYQVFMTRKYHISTPFGLFACFSISAFLMSFFALTNNTKQAKNVSDNSLMKK